MANLKNLTIAFALQGSDGNYLFVRDLTNGFYCLPLVKVSVDQEVIDHENILNSAVERMRNENGLALDAIKNITPSFSSSVHKQHEGLLLAYGGRYSYLRSREKGKNGKLSFEDLSIEQVRLFHSQNRISREYVETIVSNELSKIRQS